MATLSFIVFVDDPTEDLEGLVHGRKTAVLIVSVVDTRVTIATDLDIKPSFLEVTYEWQTASDGVRLALPKNVTSSSIQMLESRRVQVDRNALWSCEARAY